MPEIELWRIFAGLGVPGVALGVLYLLFRKYGWQLPSVPRPWVGPSFVLFLVIIWTVVIFALYLWSPGKTPPNRSKAELIALLNSRCQMIRDKLDLDVRKIGAATLKAEQELRTTPKKFLDDNDIQVPRHKSTLASIPSQDIAAPEIDRLMRESFDISQQLQTLKSQIADLHKKCIEAITDNQDVLAHEYGNQINSLLRDKYFQITAQNIGIGPGSYFKGYKHVLVDTRAITGQSFNEVYFPDKTQH